jgi:tagatose 6-phosphate kinase
VRNERDLVAAAHELCRRGAAWTLVTRGAAPAVLCNGREAWTFQVPQVRAINPIGSGDALAGGVAVALARGDGTVQACRLGIACGAANAMTLLAGQVRRSDVEALVAQVQVQAVPQ